MLVFKTRSLDLANIFMAIIKTNLPLQSILNYKEKSYDYIDSFQDSFHDKNLSIGPKEICKLFFGTGPQWVDKLFQLRNRIVKIFGLKVSGEIKDRQSLLENVKFLPGEQIGFFKFYDITENEIVMGEDDKHLNFRVSLFLEQDDITDPHLKKLTISTVVNYNNWFGRLYFLPVRPFHQLIVPSMMRGIIRGCNGEI